MKNILDLESKILNDFTDAISDRFYKLRFGIKRCSRPVCDDLAIIRYELLEWCKNLDDIYNPTPIPTTYNLLWGYVDTDPFESEESLFFQFQSTYDKGSLEVELDFTQSSAGKYLFWRIPSDEPIFTNWYNNDNNNGTIPDVIWRNKKTIGSYDYYLTRDKYYVDETTKIKFFSSGISPVDPIVNAGTDQNKQYPIVSGTLSGTVTPGTYPIINYIWSKISGPSITFSNPTSLTTNYTATTEGVYLLKLTVFDSNSNSYSDNVTVNILSEEYRVYYGFKSDDTVLNESQILASSYIVINNNQSAYTLPFQNATGLGYVWFAEKLMEPIKTKWQDSIVPINNGFIGSTDDLFGPAITVGSLRFYDTEYATQFDNPIIIKTI